MATYMDFFRQQLQAVLDAEPETLGRVLAVCDEYETANAPLRNLSPSVSRVLVQDMGGFLTFCNEQAAELELIDSMRKFVGPADLHIGRSQGV
jgi:hypothetical protein